MTVAEPQLPDFRNDGYLPVGVHVCSIAEATFRFGSGTRRRRRLVTRVRHWFELAQTVGAIKLLIDGSFVTSKAEPNDVDAVMLIPADFNEQVDQGVEAAIELLEAFESRRPEEIFAAEDEADWQGWVEFFSRTRELDGRRKGLVEILL
jgi:hypothetical protein